MKICGNDYSFILEKDGIRVPSAIAEEYRDRFDEIYVDEYQDSNEVQEQLIRAMEHGNLFLVGDVKQSIYAFRQARPKLFTEKYRTFRQDSLAAEPLPEGTDTRVDLRKNFRSRKEVLDSCNAVFSQLMAPETGGILYDSDIPDKVAINEAVELSKEYADEKSSAFVNGVLSGLVL